MIESITVKDAAAAFFLILSLVSGNTGLAWKNRIAVRSKGKLDENPYGLASGSANTESQASFTRRNKMP